jgi:formylglycine-generating enzyme required for sulfatase activity
LERLFLGFLKGAGAGQFRALLNDHSNRAAFVSLARAFVWAEKLDDGEPLSAAVNALWLQRIEQRIKEAAKGFVLTDEDMAAVEKAMLTHRPKFEQDLRRALDFELGNTKDDPDLFHFVEQPVSRYKPPKRMEAKGDEWQESSLAEVRKALLDGQSVLLVAKAGIGKSVVMRHLAVSLASPGEEALRHVPVFRKCSQLGAGLDARGLLASDGLLDDAVGDSEALCAAAARRFVKERRVVFLFDGLDQVGDAARQKTIVDALLEPRRSALGGCPVAFTSRVENARSYIPDFHQAGFAVFRIEQFSDANVDDFYGAAVLAEIEESLRGDDELRRVGFFARMVKSLHREGGLAGIQTKSDLFQKYLDGFMTPAVSSGGATQTSLLQMECCLGDISLAAYQRDNPAILEIPRSLVCCFPKHMSLLDQLSESAIVYWRPLVETSGGSSSGLLSRPLVFQHQIVQDYYAAQALRRLWDESPERFNEALGEMGTWVRQVADFLVEALDAEPQALPSEVHRLLLENDAAGERGWRLTYLLCLRDKLEDRQGTDDELKRLYQKEWDDAVQLQRDTFGDEPWEWLSIPGAGINYKMMKIPPGRSLRGGWEYQDEMPVRWITIANPLVICEHPVTVRLYRAVMKNLPWFRSYAEEEPVEGVSWIDARAFCRTLDRRARMPKNWRLPTEAEWEYACRAGTTTTRYGELDAVAWYEGNSRGAMHDVGRKRPNAFGLYDMLGNVWEWCEDDWRDKPYGSQIDGRAFIDRPRRSYRVMRGGGCGNPARHVRAGMRGWSNPADSDAGVGFRCVRDFVGLDP